MNLEDIAPSEIRQTQENECHMIPLRGGTRSSQILKDRNQDGGGQGPGGQGSVS